jgi:hypothetical protein
MMARMIQESFQVRQPVTYSAILDALRCLWEIVLSPDTLNGIPMEAGRAIIDPTAIEKWYQDLEAEIQDVPRAFVRNMDETRCYDFTNVRETRVTRSSEYQEDTIPLHLNCRCKRSRHVVCLTADRRSMKPFINLE